MKKDVGLYMKYYNNDRLHTANDDLSPADYEKRYLKTEALYGWKGSGIYARFILAIKWQENVSGLGWPVQVDAF